MILPLSAKELKKLNLISLVHDNFNKAAPKPTFMLKKAPEKHPVIAITPYPI